jgi:hypothetical protein
MADDQDEVKFSRRAFLEVSPGALAAAGVTSMTSVRHSLPSNLAHDRRGSDSSRGNRSHVR